MKPSDLAKRIPNRNDREAQVRAQVTPELQENMRQAWAAATVTNINTDAGAQATTQDA